MIYYVRLLEDAEEDLSEIITYVAAHDSPRNAERLLSNLERTCESLQSVPERGRAPPELKAIGISEYREVFFKPYRIMYRLQGTTVLIFAILDGRRELTDLLLQRLLR
jgi:toxin ParE1/3/4